MSQIGITGYTVTVAIPSVVCAAIANDDKNEFGKWMGENYYNFPTERIADQLGGVNRGYTTVANTLGALYWLYTVTCSRTS